MEINKKGQAATEFLMTYGWAILAIVIVAAVLWNMGIFKGQCTKTSGVQIFPSGDPLGVEDWSATTGNQLTFVVKNLAGKTVTINNASAGIDTNYAANYLSSEVSIASGGSGNVIVTTGGSGTSGNCFDGNVTIAYTVSGGLAHNSTGKFQGKY